MKVNEFKKRLELAGCYGRYSQTGHPDYARVYIMKKGVTYGRATIFKGAYSHYKMYGENWNHEHLSYEYVSIKYAIATGKALFVETFEEAKKKAKQVQQDTLNEKLAWRETNPKFDKNGKPKKRQKLHGKKLGPLLWAELIPLEEKV
jgi:hypothetical protein